VAAMSGRTYGQARFAPGSRAAARAGAEMRRLGVIVASAVISACSEPLPPPIAPAMDEIVVVANDNNVLSAIVSVRARNTDSVVVHFRLADDATADYDVTPGVDVITEQTSIPVLGLMPARRYALRAIAYGAGGTTFTGELELTTEELPADLPHYTAGGSDPSPGYVVFAAGAYGIVIDNAGRVVWYHHFRNGAGLAFMPQPTGRYVARPNSVDASQSASWVEVDPLGNQTRTLGCSLGMQSRLHDLIAEPDGGYWIMCDETRTLDLSAIGGVAGARVTGTAVQHLSGDGALLFHWSPFDHFAITDLDASLRTGVNVNWTHGNALDLDGDGNLIVSFRSLGEITKIDTESGSVIWRLGGRRNQFTYLATSEPAFAGQHSARSSSTGALLLLDNLGIPTESRAERYELDENTLTARLVQSYGSAPAVVTQIGGSVQQLAGGRTLVSFGTAGRVEEYDATGRVVWRIDGNAGYVFRAQRIRSLYGPE
jgi:hypothetical protein